MDMLPQGHPAETIHEALPVSDWSLWGLPFLVQPAKQVKPRFPFCLLKKCWGKKYSSTFFVSGLQAVLQALDSGHSVTALVKEYFSPVHPPCTISYLPHHSGAQSRQAGPYHQPFSHCDRMRRFQVLPSFPPFSLFPSVKILFEISVRSS